MYLICVAVWNRAVQLKVEYYMSRNIIIGKPELLEWNPESRLNSVQAIHDNVCNIVKDSVVWYQEAVVGRRRRAKCLRIFVIVIGAIAASIPTMADIWVRKDGHTPMIPVNLTTILLACTAALIVIDKFFGYTSSWIRFTMTSMNLRQALQDFRIEWETILVTWSGVEPTAEQALEAIGQCKNFLTKANTMILEETKAWKEEFEKTLKQIEDNAANAPAKDTTGAVNFTIQNGEKCKQGWKIAIDGGLWEDGSGTFASRRNLMPGNHLVRIEGVLIELVDGTSQERKVRVEKAFKIVQDEILAETLTLA
jgi:hypothetical protein